MPNSRHRHKGHHHHAQPQAHQQVSKPKPKRSAAILMAIFVGVFGLAIGAYFSSFSMPWIVLGTIIGAITGYLLGGGIDKTFSKK